MKYRLTAIAGLAICLFLIGCEKVNESVSNNLPVQFRVSSQVGKYVIKSTETTLETGDYIGVFAGNPISRNNVKMRVNGSDLEYTSDVDRIYWNTGQTVSSNFVAYVPWVSDGSFTSLSEKTLPVSVQANQGSDSDFYASDVKVANVNVNAEADVNLVFNHILAKVTITITSQLASAITQVELVNVISTGTIDLDNGSVSSPGARTSTVIAHRKSFNSSTKVYVFEAILIPDAQAQPSIRVTVDGGTTYTYTLNSSFNLAKGTESTASFTIARPGLSAVFSSFSINSWEVGSDVSSEVDQEGRSKDIAGGKWSVTGSVMGTNWDEDIMMTYDSDNTWKIDIYYKPGEEFKFRYNHSWADENTIGAKQSDSQTGTVSINPGADKALKYNDYLCSGEAYGAKNMTINGDAGWYTIYLHPFTHGANNWPTVYVAAKN